MSGSGVGGMVQAAAFCEVKLQMLTLTIGQSSDAREDCAAELVGRSLFYRIALRQGRIWLSMQLLDSPAEPECFLNINDDEGGWKVVCAVARALEEENVQSLQRPIRLGPDTGPDSWVIT